MKRCIEEPGNGTGRAGTAILFLGVMVSIATLMAGCVSQNSLGSHEAASAPSIKERWGVEVASLRLTAHDRMIDFRYRVTDPVKAATLGDRRNEAYLLDQATGTKLNVPSFPKTGSLRQAPGQLETGRIYFMFFSNPGHLVKSGGKVTIVIGDFRAENLTIQ
jgi:hypothetical protein